MSRTKMIDIPFEVMEDVNLKVNLLLNYLLEAHEDQKKLVQAQAAHPGVGPKSPIAKLTGEPTAAEQLIKQLQKQINKQQKWLEERLEEVSGLNQALADAHARRKGHALEKMRLARAIRPLLDAVKALRAQKAYTTQGDYVVLGRQFFDALTNLESCYKEVGYGSDDYQPMQ